MSFQLTNKDFYTQHAAFIHADHIILEISEAIMGDANLMLYVIHLECSVSCY